MLGLILLVVFSFFIVFADVISDYGENVVAQDTGNRFAPPSAEHWFGTDEYGRDIFSRVIHGGRVSLAVGIVSTAVSIVIASVIGAAAAFYGGWFDGIVMRILDMLMGIPLLLLAIAVAASLGAGIINLALALTAAQIPGFTRIIRSVVLNIYGMDYIEASRAYGARDHTIIFSHILPNPMGPIIVQATMSVAQIILDTAALSYLGLGMQPPAPEWGSILADGKEFMRYAPGLVVFPGLAIALSALALNLIGDGLRDALDPKLRD
jgi:peptide/nickel transport system permease protein